MTTTMIDEAYEFSAPRFYDFIKGETEEQLLKAELWFDSALSYAPSRTYIILTSSSLYFLQEEENSEKKILDFAIYLLSWFFFRLLEKKILDFVSECFWIGPNFSVYKCKLSWIFRVSWLWFEDNRNVLSLSLSLSLWVLRCGFCLVWIWGSLFVDWVSWYFLRFWLVLES